MLFSTAVIGQVNLDLQHLCKQVELVGYDSDPSFRDMYRDCVYDISIRNDSLCIGYDNLLKMTATDDTISDVFFKLKCSLNDIKKLEVSSVLEYGRARYSRLTISAVRNEELIEKTWYNNKPQYEELSTVPIHRHADTVVFQQIVERLSQYHDFSKNDNRPNCKFRNITLGLESESSIKAMLKPNLESVVKLNENENIDEEILSILATVIEQNKISNLNIMMVIGEDDQMYKMVIVEYELSKKYDSMPELSEGEKLAREAMGLTMTKTVHDEIVALLTAQKWEAGKCTNQKVKSYLEVRYNGR